MKSKYLLDGFDKLYDHEILEIALYYAIPRKNTNEIAHNLIKEFGSLSGVFDAPINLLKRVNGMGESSATFIKLTLDLFRVYMLSKSLKNNKPIGLKEARDKLALQFFGREEEIVALMLFDAKRKPIYCGVVNKGTVNSVDLYARKIMELVIMYNASSVIIGHNHPSGIALPSKDDIAATKKIKDIFENLGVKFLDHIIVADGDYVSLECSGEGELMGMLSCRAIS